MEETFLALLISGHYTDLFFNVVLTNLALALKNNLSLLLLIAVSWKKAASITKNTWDDRASSWLVNFLTRKKNGEREEV